MYGSLKKIHFKDTVIIIANSVRLMLKISKEDSTFLIIFYLHLLGKGQNVENHFIESQKKNNESIKFEKDQNIESIFRTWKV